MDIKIYGRKDRKTQTEFFVRCRRTYILNNKSLEHLNILLCIFFVSSVFQNFDVDVWPLLKADKVLPQQRLWQKKNFFKILFSIIHIFIQKDSLHLKNKVVHCYSLIYTYMKAYLDATSLSVPGLPQGSASRCQTLFDIRIEILTHQKSKSSLQNFHNQQKDGHTLFKIFYFGSRKTLLKIAFLKFFWAIQRTNFKK